MWESTTRHANWQSSRPKYLRLEEGNGIIDYLGEKGVLRILLYADGGYPPYSDELFFINKLILSFSIYEDVLKRVAQLDSVWIDGDFLLAKGVGFPTETSINPATDKANAKRAATLDAYRNLAKAIYGMEQNRETEKIQGELKGASVKDTKYYDDNAVEIILQMPLNLIGNRP